MRPWVEALEPRWMMAGPPERFVQPLGGTPYADWTITYYVDVDPSPDIIRDYAGGDYTFEGHTGLDISLPNFAKMDAGLPVLAVAGGVVTAVADGHPDRNALSQTEPENSITIDHGGGFTTFYTHLRRGALVSVGQTVTQGQQIGWVGASGNAHWPHLHFGVFENGVPIETYLDPATYWLSPLPYSGAAAEVLDSGVTNYDPAADLLERPSDMKAFFQTPGQIVYCWGFFEGLHAGDLIQFAWYRPDGSLLATSDITSRAADGADEWYYASQPLPDLPELGTWRVELLDNGVKIGEQTFAVGTSGAPEIRVAAGATYILDGRTTPIRIGGTGGVFAGTAAPTLTFSAQNHGTAPLTLGAIDLPAGYSLLEGLPPNLTPGSTANFTVRLDTIVAGKKSGQITFATNDADESTFNFPVEGLVVAPADPEVVVDLDGADIVDGIPAPVDLGSVAWGEPPLVRAITIRNVGSQNLALADLSVPAGFSIVKGLGASLPPGGVDTLTIEFDAVRVGSYEGQIYFATSDANENPFEFFVTAAVTPPSHPAPWQNPADPLNADDEPDVTSVDALVIINLLNSNLLPGGELPAPIPGFSPPSYYDVDGDNHVTPTDVLLVVNYLNSLPLPTGEGEAADVSQRASSTNTTHRAATNSILLASLLDLLAADSALDPATGGHLGKRPGVR